MKCRHCGKEIEEDSVDKVPSCSSCYLPWFFFLARRDYELLAL